MLAELAVCAFVGVVSWIGTLAMIVLARRKGLIDVPNERSSHSVPTPRGGGLAICVAVAIGLLLLWDAGLVDSRTTSILLVGGGAVAVVGLVDDTIGLGAVPRLLVHAAAASFAVLSAAPQIVDSAPGMLGALVTIAGSLLSVVWALNLFNFMDGIDALAAMEACFLGLAGALITFLGDGSVGQTTLFALLAVAAGGFLAWNWPPARIFMGDVGSGFLGYSIAALVFAVTAMDGQISAIPYLILAATFVADATVTLSTRLMSGENVLRPHRSHAYQRLARRWDSHRRVTATYLAVNILWLLPLAVLAVRIADRAVLIAAVAYGPLVTAAILIGAGRREGRGDIGK